jgi:hypothetical protein
VTFGEGPFGPKLASAFALLRHPARDLAALTMTAMGDQDALGATRLWELGIGEVTAHNLEAHGREEVNRLLKDGWVLLLIYTLHYHDDGIWRERPMAILGKPGRMPSGQ